MYTWKIYEESVGKRADVFVAEKLPELSRSSIQKLASQGKLLINKTAEKTSMKLKAGMEVALDYDIALLSEIPDIDIPVLYEDENCIVMDKPKGVLTHSKGVFNPEATVATFIANKLTDMAGERAGIVHRLDRATSGVIIAAKNPEAMQWLQKQFSQRRTKKTYIAIIEGKLNPEAALVDIPIERNPRKPQTFRTGAGGKEAITAYKTIKTNGTYSQLELAPQTGRTHQLRVHLKHLDHPIVGDTLYDGQAADRLYLHAYKLELTLPSRERKVFTSNIPASFDVIMK